MSSQNITVPDIGGAEGVEIIEICVAAGDQVEAEQSIIVIETDKASVDVPCPAAGVIKEISVAVGDKVSEGDLIGVLDGAGESAAPAAAPAAEPAAEPAPAPAAEPAPAAGGSAVDCVVPDGVEDAEVIEVTISVGDTISEGDTVAVLETDKATVDVPATASGSVTALAISVGDKLNSGDVVANLASGAAPASEPAPASAPAPAPAAETPVAAAPVSADVTATVPDGAEDAEIIEIAISVGDDIAEGDTLAVLETDKATVDVPANAAGKVKKILIEIGQKVSSGDQVAILAGSAPAASAPEPAAPAPAASSPASPATAVAPAKESTGGLTATAFSSASDVYAGPAVRTHARDLGVDLTQVKATGPRGRILKSDVDGYVKQLIANKDKPAAAGAASGGIGIPAMPKVDFSKFGDVEIKPMTKIQKITAANMHRNWLNIPAVTQFDDADITDLEKFRKGLKAEAEKRGVKLTPLPFLLKAAAAALRHEPTFNVSLSADGESIVHKDYVHIGMAADTPSGLLVPVLRDVDKKGLWELAAEANELIKKARDGKLKPADMQGGCFTISSLGAMGGKGFTPIVNAPEVAIMGVSKAEVKPVWNGSEFVPRNMLPLAVSYDHRAINGADAGRFFTYLVSVLSDVRRLLL